MIVHTLFSISAFLVPVSPPEHFHTSEKVNSLLPKAAYLHHSPKAEVHRQTLNFSVQLNVPSEKCVHTLTLHFLRHFGRWLCSRTIQLSPVLSIF
jgi:hypothetical protein